MSYNIDFAHSQIQFTVRHMMISRVRGVFDKFEGQVNLDEHNPTATTVDIRISADSINTREEKRDAHLRSADFLAAENYPYLTFTGKRVEQTGPETARLTGDLTIRGISREVVLEVVYNGSARSPWGATSFGFNAHTVINRKNWDLTWNAALETGGVLVGDEISIDIELELVKTPEQAAVQS